MPPCCRAWRGRSLASEPASKPANMSPSELGDLSGRFQSTSSYLAPGLDDRNLRFMFLSAGCARRLRIIVYQSTSSQISLMLPNGKTRNRRRRRGIASASHLASARRNLRDPTRAAERYFWAAIQLNKLKGTGSPASPWTFKIQAPAADSDFAEDGLKAAWPASPSPLST